MSVASETLSGKTHRDENFPVASWLVAPQFRAPILAYYRFARAADDIADHAALDGAEKVARLDRMQAALEGTGPADADVEPLRLALRERGLSPQHALDLLEAFRRDSLGRRYETWADLIDYCRLSAMPVGRFVLDVHGEDRVLWPASDALCAALQVINHLQDCGKDYKTLNRVYLPDEILNRYGADHAMLDAQAASPALLATIRDMAQRTAGLVDEGAHLVPQIRELRLGLEIAVIDNLARHLVRRLGSTDPLSGKVHHGKLAFAGIGLLGMARYMVGRVIGRRPAPVAS